MPATDLRSNSHSGHSRTIDGSSSVQITNMQVHRDFQGMSIPQSEIDDARGEVQSELKKVVDAMPVFFQLINRGLQHHE